jgi:hypothetical protein
VAQDTRNRSEGFELEEHQWQQVTKNKKQEFIYIEFLKIFQNRHNVERLERLESLPVLCKYSPPHAYGM